MTEKTIVRIKNLYGWVLSASIFAAGICLIAACVGIYHDGAFSREAVAIAFANIRIPVYLCLGLVLGSLPLALLPGEQPKKTIRKQYAMILARLSETADLSATDPSLRSEILRQRNRRQLHRGITAASTAIALAVFLIYCLSGDRFHQSEITPSMIRAMCVLVPGLVIAGGYGIFTGYFCQASMIREIELLKQAAKGGKADLQPKDRQLARLRTAVLVIAVAALVFGFSTGGTKEDRKSVV